MYISLTDFNVVHAMFATLQRMHSYSLFILMSDGFVVRRERKRRHSSDSEDEEERRKESRRKGQCSVNVVVLYSVLLCLCTLLYRYGGNSSTSSLFI